ncbi:MAG: SCP2 sterol-binding domain-containing protein [Hyphomicrobiales bacterium]|nr:SCP2 sterol-binding domain-containing protein [Hyphomicrobiales bacterium]
MRGQIPALLAQIVRPLPLLPLELMVRRLVDNAVDARPSLASRLADSAGTTIAVDPIDCPFAFLITLGLTRPRVRAVPDLSDCSYQTRIAAPLLVLLGLVDGSYDGDAVFFSRDLVIEGDTEAALALRNAIENAELDAACMVGVPAALRAPFNRVTQTLLDRLRRSLEAPEPTGPRHGGMPE